MKIINYAMRAFAATALFYASTLPLSGEEVDHLKVGDTVPEGMIGLESGEWVKLSEQLAGEPALLIFYRGGWCPFCVKQLAELNDIADEISAEGIRLLAISADKPEKLKAKEKLSALDYALFSDSKMTLSRAFGIAFEVDPETVEKYKGWGIDLEGDSGETHHMLPHPSVFVVDGEGVIQFAHVDPNYKERLAPEKVLTAIRTVAN